MLRRVSLLAVALIIACSGPTVERRPGPPQKSRGAVTLTVIGTNDLHGATERLPILAGYIRNVREARERGGGGLVIVDAGDMFQGTLESNLNEGAAVIAAYNRIGYTAAAVGNHEFDFGPAGERATPTKPGDDPRGALKARAAEADFPILMANVIDSETGKRADYPNMPASTMVEAAGVQVGIIGVTTEATPYTTMPINFRGLAMAPLAATIAAEAQRLRKQGAQVIIVAAHAGSKCEDLHDPNDLSTCDTDEEIFQVARTLPARAVDVIVAGHTHAAMAHRVNDIAILESYSSGRAFGRIDLRINKNGVVTGANLFQPQMLCPGEEPIAADDCKPGSYEGQPVEADSDVRAAILEGLVAAKQVREKPLGVDIKSKIWRKYDEESALGNLFVDLMLEARPNANVALTNGGGLRADIPAGPLTYGGLYEAMPFDNRFAEVKLTGAHLRKLVTRTLYGSSGIFSFAGARAIAVCKDGQLEVTVVDAKGKPIADDAKLVLVTSDFIASGGDGAIGRLGLPEGAVTLDEEIIRDSLADVLIRRGGSLSGDDPALFDGKARRLSYPGSRPVKCAK